MNDQVAIRLRDVVVTYQRQRSFFGRRTNRFTALKDVSLSIGRGEKVGIIGSNGAGKSTLLRVLVGALKPDSGAIIRNHDHDSCRLLALGTGFMVNLSGRENAVLSGLILGMERRQIVSRLEQVKDFSGLGEFFDQPVRTYSSGMRARLGFAVAIQQRPDVLLIDETLSVGDAAFKDKCLGALRDRMREHSTVVLVSHSAGLVMDVCDRVVWLRNGEVVRSGDPEAVYSEYREAAGRAA